MSTPSDPRRGRPWVLSMRWHDLLFAHWRVDARALRTAVPGGLEIDTFDGSAWIAVVPFRMSAIRPRCLPALPRLSAFPELNVRTYVTRGGRPGVYFFSLDAAEPLAVRVARAVWGLNYLDADMRCARDADGAVRYASRRTHRGEPPAELRCRYEPVGGTFRSKPGTLEHFLTERYCLFTSDRRGTLRRGDIAHEPWPLQRAVWDVDECDLLRVAGIAPPSGPPHLLFARELAVQAWLPVRCGSASARG